MSQYEERPGTALRNKFCLMKKLAKKELNKLGVSNVENFENVDELSPVSWEVLRICKEAATTTEPENETHDSNEGFRNYNIFVADLESQDHVSPSSGNADSTNQDTPARMSLMSFSNLFQSDNIVGQIVINDEEPCVSLLEPQTSHMRKSAHALYWQTRIGKDVHPVARDLTHLLILLRVEMNNLFQSTIVFKLKLSWEAIASTLAEKGYPIPNSTIQKAAQKCRQKWKSLNTLYKKHKKNMESRTNTNLPSWFFEMQSALENIKSQNTKASAVSTTDFTDDSMSPRSCSPITGDNDSCSTITGDNDFRSTITEDNDFRSTITEDNDSRSPITEDNDSRSPIIGDNDYYTLSDYQPPSPMSPRVPPPSSTPPSASVPSSPPAQSRIFQQRRMRKRRLQHFRSRRRSKWNSLCSKLETYLEKQDRYLALREEERKHRARELTQLNRIATALEGLLELKKNGSTVLENLLS
ncbi:hypothetical protein M8J77_016873 [Diaphorina citri]|nr:hypothetical protein M8J77_016873 [Diaphorina citri]